MKLGLCDMTCEMQVVPFVGESKNIENKWD